MSSPQLRDASQDDLPRIAEMGRHDGRGFVSEWPLERHETEFARPDVFYKAICDDDELVGFALLVLDPDGRSLEFRRIVVASPGRGYGTRVVGMLDDIARALGRGRIWLDVYEENERARRIYGRLGYREFGRVERDGRPMILMEKELA